jgi:hypothetical protein
MPTRRPLFPRSADRGLIEARASESWGSTATTHFRDQLIAASLKPALAQSAYDPTPSISAIS